MTDNDIILGLKCLADEDEILCKDCAFRYMDRGFACKKNVSKAAIDLINRQKTRTLELQGDLKFVRGTVERLLELSDEQKAKIEQLKEAYSVYEETTGLKQVRAEAIREFAEKIDQLLNRYSNLHKYADKARHSTEEYPDGTPVEMVSVWEVLSLKKWEMVEYETMSELQGNIETIAKEFLLSELEKDFHLLIKEMTEVKK